MIKSDILIADFYQKQKKFCYLESVKLNRNINENGCSEYFIDVVLCDCPFYAGDNKLLINFEGVKDIQIGHVEGLLKLLITIVNVSESQLENIRFKVKEDENNQFTF